MQIRKVTGTRPALVDIYCSSIYDLLFDRHLRLSGLDHREYLNFEARLTPCSNRAQGFSLSWFGTGFFQMIVAFILPGKPVANM